MKHVQIIKNPIVCDGLTYLRDRRTDTQTFRCYADRVSLQLLSAAVSDSDLQKKSITTPLMATRGNVLNSNFVFITIFRAGLAMLPAALHLFPFIPVGFIGLKRDEQTAIAHEYYVHLPKITKDSIVLLADPMLATGGSMRSALREISLCNPKEIRIVSIVSAPEGVEAVHTEFPEITIITAAVDSHLNDKKYIVPGLGDFGDRYFGTTL